MKPSLRTKQRKMSTRWTQIISSMQPAIRYFSSKVVASCDIPLEDTEQELMIVVWLSTLRYEEVRPTISLESWIKTDLYYKARNLIRERCQAFKRTECLYQQLQTLRPHYSEDHADIIIKKTALDQILRRQNKSRQIVDMRLDGFRIDHIGQQVGLDKRRVSEILKGVRNRVTAA